MSYLSIHINKSKIDFIKKHYSYQIQALEQFYPIIKSAISQGVPSYGIKFGGGTALAMYHFQHRLSFDIDLFLTNQQYLSFFSPKFWIDDFDTFNSDEYIDKFNHIGIVTKDEIKIDILVDSNLDKGYLDNSKQIFPFDVYVESVEDIIAKKIVFRKKDNKTRDIFDMAVALEKDENLFDTLLKKDKIKKQDLKELKEALQNLNLAKYNSQIKIIEPIEKYKNIALNAPEFLINRLN